MAMIKLVRNDVEFEVYTHTDFQGCMICGTIYQVVRPKWKIFRTSYLHHFSFWIDDFDTIREGVEFCLDSYLNEVKEREERYRKYEEFVNGG